MRIGKQHVSIPRTLSNELFSEQLLHLRVSQQPHGAADGRIHLYWHQRVSPNAERLRSVPKVHKHKHHRLHKPDSRLHEHLQHVVRAGPHPTTSTVLPEIPVTSRAQTAPQSAQITATVTTCVPAHPVTCTWTTTTHVRPLTIVRQPAFAAPATALTIREIINARVPLVTSLATEPVWASTTAPLSPTPHAFRQLWFAWTFQKYITARATLLEDTSWTPYWDTVSLFQLRLMDLQLRRLGPLLLIWFGLHRALKWSDSLLHSSDKLLPFHLEWIQTSPRPTWQVLFFALSTHSRWVRRILNVVAAQDRTRAL